MGNLLELKEQSTLKDAQLQGAFSALSLLVCGQPGNGSATPKQETIQKRRRKTVEVS